MLESISNNPVTAVVGATLTVLSGLVVWGGNEIYNSIKSDQTENHNHIVRVEEKVEKNRDGYATLATYQAVTANDVAAMKSDVKEIKDMLKQMSKQ